MTSMIESQKDSRSEFAHRKENHLWHGAENSGRVTPRTEWGHSPMETLSDLPSRWVRREGPITGSVKTQQPVEKQ